jgi:6-pyruvoyltetrahydropterin/6-carboxytetrahydropterin synthase
MIRSITIEIPFRAGHRLIAPYKGKCNNVHGEGYTAIVELKSERIDQNGMVADFGKTKKKIKNWIDKNWDHAYIYTNRDEVGHYLAKKGFKTFNIGDSNPTAEIMAEELFYRIKMSLRIKSVSKVGIVESFRDSIAWYEQ